MAQVQESGPSLFGQRLQVSLSFALSSGKWITLFVSAAKKSNILNNDPNDSYQDPDHPETVIPLYANYIWPGSLVLSDYIIINQEIFRGKEVLELGAGTALPAMVASKADAALVVATDYPDPTIIDNMKKLVDMNNCTNMHVLSHIWGDQEQAQCLTAFTTNHGFDIILLAEVLWKDTYLLHRSLLESVDVCVKRPGGVIFLSLVHRPTMDHRAEHDLEFLQLAEKEFNLKSTYLYSCKKYPDAMEREDVEVFIYRLDAEVRC
jgi:predicted nicotinamide N-methyase